MTTPKNPEQIMEEFALTFPNTSPPSIEREDVQGFLRSSMSSLLCYMAERIGKHKEGEGRWCDTGEDMDWECRSECVESARSVLIEEARKITDGGKTEEETEKIQALSNMLTFFTGKKPNE